MKHLRTVGDVMTRSVISVGKGAPFKDIVEAMRQSQVSALPVLSAENGLRAWSPRRTCC